MGRPAKALTGVTRSVGSNPTFSASDERVGVPHALVTRSGRDERREHRSGAHRALAIPGPRPTLWPLERSANAWLARWAGVTSL
jgi:hypothetical protein